ncbi:MAG: hypothetical protein CME59_11520 [Halioglobus sp.]|nr:hypothetical protein [Halioglobus sp.]|tara:strand:+ start:423 stop:1106 length:684 start_codon:yes stop_codon:yes gene_type:complete
MIRVGPALLCLLAAAGAHAEIFVHGNLSSDSGGSVITDSVSGREYLRFDQVHLTYSDTLAAVAPGGIYEDWSIADRTVAEAFIDSFLGGVTSCNGPGFEGECGTAIGWSDGNFGDNSQSGQPPGYNDDTFAFISDTGIYPLGSVGIRDDGVVFQQEAWGDAAQLDFWGFVVPPHIDLLLYRDVPVDTDEDGIPDSEDNCPLVANPGQEPSLVEPGRGVACEGLPPGC